MQHVNAETPDNTTLVLSWRPPEPTNGDILNYIVIVSSYDGKNVIMEENVTITNFTTYNLGRLIYW